MAMSKEDVHKQKLEKNNSEWTADGELAAQLSQEERIDARKSKSYSTTNTPVSAFSVSNHTTNAPCSVPLTPIGAGTATANVNATTPEANTKELSAHIKTAADNRALGTSTSTTSIPLANAQTFAELANQHPLIEIYEICGARLEFTEILLEWVDKTDYYQLKTYCQKRHPTLLPIPKTIEDLKSAVNTILRRYIEKYKHVMSKISAGANQDDIDDLYFFLKEISYRKYNLHNQTGPRKHQSAKNNKTKFNQSKEKAESPTLFYKSEPEENTLRQILAKLKPTLSDEACEILEKGYVKDTPAGTLYDFKKMIEFPCDTMKEWWALLEKYGKVLIESKFALAKTEMDYVTHFSTEFHVIQELTQEKLIADLDIIDLQLKTNPTCNITLLLKNCIQVTKHSLTPVYKQIQYLNKMIALVINLTAMYVKFKEEMNRCVQVSINLLDLPIKSRSTAYPTLTALDITHIQQTYEKFELSIDTLAKHFTEQFKIRFPIIQSQKGTEKIMSFENINNDLEDIAQQITIVLNNHEIYTLQQLIKIEQAKKQASDNAKETAQTSSLTNGTSSDSNAKTASENAAGQKTSGGVESVTMVHNRLSTSVTASSTPQAITLEDWTKHVEERRAEKTRLANESRLKATEDLRLQVKKKREAQNKFALPLADLKLREEKIHISLRQNPTIQDLFLALYSFHPETKQPNCFGHADLMKLIGALKVQRFLIALEFRDSHYCITIEGTYGYMEQENLSENASAVKAHGVDLKYFSGRTLNGLRKMFMRAGFTPEVLGISPELLAPGTKIMLQSLTHGLVTAHNTATVAGVARNVVSS